MRLSDVCALERLGQGGAIQVLDGYAVVLHFGASVCAARAVALGMTAALVGEYGLASVTLSPIAQSAGIGPGHPAQVPS